jgi:glycosyltransferase involved in cell wall biosynthesis
MAFEENGFSVVPCFVDPRQYPGLKKYIALIKLRQSIKDQSFEQVIVCYPGHSVVWLARLLFGRKIIFDAFLSLYDANVNDRKLYSPYHPKAWYDWFLDFSSMHLAGEILIDTFEHAKYLCGAFFVSRRKVIRFLVSTDPEVFYPREKMDYNTTFIAHFHGSYIPLQGIRYILDAAKILEKENVTFRLIGRGQEYPSMRKYAEDLNLKNLEFIEWVPYETLPELISQADVCLGIFGFNAKAKRVIPNKVYEAAAMGKPVITADSPAIREVFTAGLNVIPCSPGDGESIARAILGIKSDPEAFKIGEEARRLFEADLNPKSMGERLLNSIA